VCQGAGLTRDHAATELLPQVHAAAELLPQSAPTRPKPPAVKPLQRTRTNTTCELVTKKWPGDPLAKAAADTDLRIVPNSTIAGCYRAN